MWNQVSNLGSLAPGYNFLTTMLRFKKKKKKDFIALDLCVERILLNDCVYGLRVFFQS